MAAHPPLNSSAPAGSMLNQFFEVLVGQIGQLFGAQAGLEIGMSEPLNSPEFHGFIVGVNPGQAFVQLRLEWRDFRNLRFLCNGPQV